MRFGYRIGKKSNKRAPDLYTEVEDPKDVSLKPKEQFGKLRNWIDFLRAAAGGIALISQIPDFGNVCFAVDPSLPSRMRYEEGHRVLLLQMIILVITVFIQTVKPERRLTLVAPVFFLLGLSFGIIGWKAALFAFIIIWAFNLVLPSPAVFLLVLAAVEMGFGLIPTVGAAKTYVLLAVCLTITPVLISALTKRRLTELSKKVRSKREIVKE